MNATTVKLSVRQWATEDRPSNKLQTLGAEALTDSELLAILVGSGTPQRNAVEIGQDIMSRFDHNLAKLGGRGTRHSDESELQADKERTHQPGWYHRNCR